MTQLIRFALCAAALLAAAIPASAQAVAPSAAAPVQGFSVVLVLGSLKDSTERFAAELPRGATRALGDLVDFLPYRSYRLLDSAWILNPGAGRVTSRLRGPDNNPYDVSLDSSTTGTSGVTVKFTLREGGRNGGPAAYHAAATQKPLAADLASLEATLAKLEFQLAQLSRIYAPKHPDVLRTRDEIERVRAEIRAARTRQDQPYLETITAGASIIDTGFTMNLGETVVVGTSRLQGDAALIVLLTAVPRGSK